MNNNKRYIIKQYIMLTIMTGIVLMIYLTLNHAQAYKLISFDKDKAVNNFVYNIIQGNGISIETGIVNFLFFCEYNLQNIVIYFISVVVKNVELAINIYYILTFFLIAYTMYWFMDKLEISKRIAMYISVFAAFIPFHIDRGQGQIITSSFFMVPLFMGIMLETIYKDNTEKRNIGYLIIMLLAPFIDIRLSVMMLLLSIILLLNHGKWNTVRSVFIYLAPLLISSVLVILLTGIFRATDLDSSIQLARDEGFRLCDMIMPLRYHFIRRFSDFRVEYDVTFQASGESGLNSMGTVLSICFIIGLFCVFFVNNMDKRIQWMSWINVIVILISNTRGFNLIFEYLGIHILYWNRMAVFILVNSMAIMGILAQRIYLKVKNKKTMLMMNCVYILVGVLGMLELILRQNL